ncbi:MAG TPA: hypothetical protein VKQ71_12070 [Acidimicrobiales bacterium]|nr:hypothetical protein [Acidimicrobiales bacterium]
MGSQINTDHDPPKKRDLNEDGQDMREHVTIKARPGDHPKRVWKRAHRVAGYHLQDWRPVTPDHECLGEYEFEGGSFTVTYLERGWTGAPEYEIRYADGGAQTCLDHEVVDTYAAQHEAKRKQTK